MPAAAQACGMSGGCSNSGLMVSAVYAVLAALGYWVMQNSVKETSACVKRTGVTVGTALVIIGLAGLLCGVASHVKNTMSNNYCAPRGAMMMRHGCRMAAMADMPAPADAETPAPAKKAGK